MSDTSLNLIVGVAGIVVGLVGAYAFHRLEKKERRPVYLVTGNVVVRADQQRNIEVRHRDKVVPVVTRTVITFWNAGREPIRRSDLLDNHPLTTVS